jgi:hypothetical protein
MIDAKFSTIKYDILSIDTYVNISTSQIIVVQVAVK